VLDVVVVLDEVVVGGIVVVVVLVVGATVDVVVVVDAALPGPNVQPLNAGHSAMTTRIVLRHRVAIRPTVPPPFAK
ncbi:MAG: hypothetical protein ACXV8L_15940, partial [Ilumatobacteraceae bacterium]